MLRNSAHILSRHQRRIAHPVAGLLSQRYHPPDRHCVGEEARLKVVEVTPVGEIIGDCGHYCFTSGTICWLMWEDYDREVGKKVASAA
jgi:hypothetical protein